MMLCFGFIAMGQKQQTDAKTLEVNFSPLGGNPISINGLKFRKFTSDYTALRLEVFVGSSSEKDVSMQEGATVISFEDNDVANPLTYSRSGSFDLSIRPGIEKHFDGTNRLSPYVGGALNIGYSSSSETEEYWSPEDFTADSANPNNFAEWEQKTKDGSISFGLNALAGMDFYFADNLYLGAEFGFGFNFTSMSPTKYSSDNDEAWAVSSANPFGEDTNFGNGEFEQSDEGTITSVSTRDDEKNGTSFNLGPNVNGALRLGFIF